MSGWIAELRQRLGLAPLRRAAADPAPGPQGRRCGSERGPPNAGRRARDGTRDRTCTGADAAAPPPRAAVPRTPRRRGRAHGRRLTMPHTGPQIRSSLIARSARHRVRAGAAAGLAQQSGAAAGSGAARYRRARYAATRAARAGRGHDTAPPAAPGAQAVPRRQRRRPPPARVPPTPRRQPRRQRRRRRRRRAGARRDRIGSSSRRPTSPETASCRRCCISCRGSARTSATWSAGP